MSQLHLIIMSWQFWALCHLVLLGVVVTVALRRKSWWCAGLSAVGSVFGAALAVVPLWLLMRHTEAQTGVGAGNVGIFFCCSVPLVPLVGLAVGASSGAAIDTAKRSSASGRCANCGYDLRENVSERCPECGSIVAS